MIRAAPTSLSHLESPSAAWGLPPANNPQYLAEGSATKIDVEWETLLSVGRRGMLCPRSDLYFWASGMRRH